MNTKLGKLELGSKITFKCPSAGGLINFGTIEAFSQHRKGVLYVKPEEDYCGKRQPDGNVRIQESEIMSVRTE